MSLEDAFVFPAGVEIPQALQAVRGQGGVVRYEGDSTGIPHRFFTKRIYNEDKAALTGKEEWDEYEMIEYKIDSLSIPVFVVEEEHKLRHPESYLRFKQGVESEGTPLNNADFISVRDLGTLNQAGIYTIEQFAAMPTSAIRAKFHSSFGALHARACQYANSHKKDSTESQVEDLQASNQKLQAEMKALKAMITGNASVDPDEDPAPKKKAGRPKKVKGDL